MHPVLARLLAEWKATGWAAKYGRAPRPDDLMFPTEDHEVRDPSDTLKALKKDLANVGLRPRRGHDLRRTFITLAQVDGARRDILKTLTHPSETDIVGLYSTFPWATVCDEIAKLRIELPLVTLGSPAAPITERATIEQQPALQSQPIAYATRKGETAAPLHATAASYSPGYNPDCSFGFENNFGELDATPTAYASIWI